MPLDLPIRFPTQTEVIDEEVARFRALSPAGRTRALGEMFDMYHRLSQLSGRAAAIRQLADAEENRGRAAIVEFTNRHV